MEKKKNNCIVCFSTYWNENSVYGIGNVILEFHKNDYKILWVNSMPNRNPSSKRTGTKRVLFKNILRKLKHHVRLIRKREDNFYILTPFYIPLVENPIIYKWNLFLLKLQVNMLLLLLQIKDYNVISSTTIDIPYIFAKKRYKKYLHYVADLYSDYREVSDKLREKIRVREKRIFNYADYVLVSSQHVLSKVNKITLKKEKIVYFPHGVDYNHFNTQKFEIPPKLSELKKPIIGYFGSLTMANDQDVFVAIANAGFTLVLIGRVSGDYSKCEENINIHFTGPISYSELPNYSKEFDVAIMAWRPSEWITNSNPKKTYEYLAQGKPIVCNSIPEIQAQLSDYVYFADSPLDFVKMCRLALEENSIDLEKKRKVKAKESDWNNKFKELIELIND